MDLSRFPRRIYTNAPTPIEPLPHFTKALAASCPGGAGPEVWIKRDDMLGLFPGGNKTRNARVPGGRGDCPGLRHARHRAARRNPTIAASRFPRR